MDQNCKDTGHRSFSRIFEKIDQGGAEELAAKQLHELMKSLRDESLRLGGQKTKGSMTINIKFDVEKDTVGVKYEVTSKKPKAVTAGSVFFLDQNANLSREAPKQIGLPLRPVPVDQNEEAGDAPAVQEA